MPLFGHSKKTENSYEPRLRETSLTESKMNRMAFNAEDPECDTIRAMVTSPVSVEYERLSEMTKNRMNGGRQTFEDLKEVKHSDQERTFLEREDEERSRARSEMISSAPFNEIDTQTHLSSPRPEVKNVKTGHCGLAEVEEGRGRESLENRAQELKSIGTEKMESAKEKAEDLWDKTKEKADELKDSVQGKVNDIKETMKEKASRDDERIEEERTRSREKLLRGESHRVYIEPGLNVPLSSERTPTKITTQQTKTFEEREREQMKEPNGNGERIDVETVTAKIGPVAFTAEDPEVDAVRTFRALLHRFSA